MNELHEEALKDFLKKYERSPKKTNSGLCPMDTRADKKKTKQLQKKIDIFERTVSKTEVRPCQGDDDLKKRRKKLQG